ncbi:hypothetical protein CgunFtcFv8_007648 [Champsocephalus gunnari]|uniref:Uncharacterized protein n=1 Tax=Champsocephalus gunnari TaxID=52237 RepID=A0AAN8H643_CHAGU|nr:hypothetical protein CgunFtcFv8_007648 [Champsocephalus gunnari]
MKRSHCDFWATSTRLPSHPILLPRQPGRSMFCPIPCLPLRPHSAVPRPLAPPSPGMLSVGRALSVNSPLQWQAVSPSEKTPDLKRALRTLLSKMKDSDSPRHSTASNSSTFSSPPSPASPHKAKSLSLESTDRMGWDT